MNFKEHFEKFEADIRKKMLDDETIIESLKEVCRNHQELNKRLENLIAGLSKTRKIPADPFFYKKFSSDPVFSDPQAALILLHQSLQKTGFSGLLLLLY